jgi:histidinol-phosphate/aromatic aminotransferase/cobyric acid decarboxylase-like protein
MHTRTHIVAGMGMSMLPPMPPPAFPGHNLNMHNLNGLAAAAAAAAATAPDSQHHLSHSLEYQTAYQAAYQAALMQTQQVGPSQCVAFFQL